MPKKKTSQEPANRQENTVPPVVPAPESPAQAINTESTAGENIASVQTGGDVENKQSDPAANINNSAEESAASAGNQSNETSSISSDENVSADNTEQTDLEKPPVERSGSNIKSGVITKKVRVPGFRGYFGKFFFDDEGVLADGRNPQVKDGITIYPALVVTEAEAGELHEQFTECGFNTQIEFLD